MPDGWVPAHVVADYAGAARSVMTAWKERGRRDVSMHLAHSLARALDAAVAALRADDDESGRCAVVPIPASRAALRRRGEDTWERVVRQAIASTASPSGLTLARSLRLTRQPRDQAGLTAADRRANLTGALACHEPPGDPVIIVDDIITTGATLAEAARALRVAGADVRGAAAVAATSRARDRVPPPHW